MKRFRPRITKDVPLPPERYHSKYPLQELEVGECALYERVPEADRQELYQSLHYARVHAQRKMQGTKFAVRRIPSGVGVWRIK